MRNSFAITVRSMFSSFPSGAKALNFSAWSTARLKPRPFKAQRLSAACKGAHFQNRVMERDSSFFVRIQQEWQ